MTDTNRSFDALSRLAVFLFAAVVMVCLASTAACVVGRCRPTQPIGLYGDSAREPAPFQLCWRWGFGASSSRSSLPDDLDMALVAGERAAAADAAQVAESGEDAARSIVRPVSEFGGDDRLDEIGNDTLLADQNCEGCALHSDVQRVVGTGREPGEIATRRPAAAAPQAGATPARVPASQESGASAIQRELPCSFASLDFRCRPPVEACDRRAAPQPKKLAPMDLRILQRIIDASQPGPGQLPRVLDGEWLDPLAP